MGRLSCPVTSAPREVDRLMLEEPAVIGEFCCFLWPVSLDSILVHHLLKGA